MIMLIAVVITTKNHNISSNTDNDANGKRKGQVMMIMMKISDNGSSN